MAAGVTTSTQPNGKRAAVFINRLPTDDPLPQRYTVTIPARQDELPTFPRLLPPMPQRQSLQPKPQPRPLPAALDAEEVNPQTWRRIELLAWKADEETCDVVLLRPLWWIEQSGAKVGGLIRLAMPEMGVAGPAKVLSIGPCPPIQEHQPGTQIVTGTFKHKAKLGSASSSQGAGQAGRTIRSIHWIAATSFRRGIFGLANSSRRTPACPLW